MSGFGLQVRVESRFDRDAVFADLCPRGEVQPMRFQPNHLWISSIRDAH